MFKRRKLTYVPLRYGAMEENLGIEPSRVRIKTLCVPTSPIPLISLVERLGLEPRLPGLRPGALPAYTITPNDHPVALL